ncbi:UDP-3-O-glucosamine N-acyltransferase [Lentinula edodes]|uniref:Translation initiation factor eIF2B subunit gamma n=1 Tax=Lentinula edodes TaxID=5353 RepID=A0A1Q3ETZ9_LENED|nr:UDP-3-O-glucosamine N-acyltransferase [Lentinula edodes]
MDLGVATSGPITREFSAVVIAGFGNELVPLTSNNGAEPCPKALVPLANKPMIDYVMSWIEQAGVKDVLLICPSIHRPMISHHVHSGLSTLRIDVQTYDESPEGNTGTCTLLRHFANRISEDFILLPCDFIPPPSLSLSTILNKHRTESNSLVEDWGSIPPPVPIVWDDATGTLLQVDTADDLDRNSEELELRMSLLLQYPRTKLSNRYQDSHVYVCRRSVLDLLQEKKHFDSFREEFIPWLCKVQYQRTKREKYGHILNPVTNVITQDVSLRHSTLRAQAKVYSKSLESGYRATCRIRDACQQHPLTVRYESTPETTYALPTDPQNRSLIDPKAQISSDTIIGKHCVLGKMARITGCVLLDHCVIEDGAKIDGCILGKNTKVGAKAELTRCVTQAGYEVGSGETFKNEKLDVSDWTAGPDESEEDEDDDEEENDDDDDEDEEEEEEDSEEEKD